MKEDFITGHKKKKKKSMLIMILFAKHLSDAVMLLSENSLNWLEDTLMLYSFGEKKANW